MSESKVSEARDTHLDGALANMHAVTVAGELTHLEALSLHIRAALGIAYDAKGNMTEALDSVETYFNEVIKEMRKQAQPRITHIVEDKKIHLLN